MRFEKKKITLVDELIAYQGRLEKSKLLLLFQEKLYQYLYIIHEFVDNDIDKLPDAVFYKLLYSVYTISFEEEDELKILSQKYQKHYRQFTEIDTSMTFYDTKTEGKGRSLSWWNQLYQVKYVVVLAEDCQLDRNTVFSVATLKKMIHDKKIVIVDEKAIPVEEETKFQREPVQYFKVVPLNFCFEGNDSMYYNENFPIVVSYLRKKCSQKRILRDMKQCIQDLQLELDEILENTPSGYFSEELLCRCKEWFEGSELKKIYKELSKKIENKNSIF